MEAFSPKGAGATVNRTLALSRRQIAAGITIKTIDSVTAAVLSGGEDPDPSAILSGSPARNATAVVYGGITIGVHQAAIQTITGGVVGVTYVITFNFTLSTDEISPEQAAQYISQYDPP